MNRQISVGLYSIRMRQIFKGAHLILKFCPESQSTVHIIKSFEFTTLRPQWKQKLGPSLDIIVKRLDTVSWLSLKDYLKQNLTNFECYSKYKNYSFQIPYKMKFNCHSKLLHCLLSTLPPVICLPSYKAYLQTVLNQLIILSNRLNIVLSNQSHFRDQ